MIIRARVRARLLGLHLLTLDAHITAGNGDDGSASSRSRPNRGPSRARCGRPARRIARQDRQSRGRAT